MTRVGTLAAIWLWLGAALPAEEVLRSWEFETAGDLEGWVANAHLRGSKVSGGCLWTTVTGSDPILAQDALGTPLPARPTQAIEVRLFARASGHAEFFWTNTTQTQYGGFLPGKQTSFAIQPGWHTYRVRPFWQAEGKIIKLRFDLPGTSDGSREGQTYQIDFIRILELGSSGEAQRADWAFGEGGGGWRIEGDGMWRADRGGLAADLKPGARLEAPPVSIDARENAFISFLMSVERGSCGRIYWSTANSNGVHHVDFPVLADGRGHVYNVPVGPAKQWQTPVIYLALEPAVGQSGTVRIEWLRASPNPAGPPELEVQRFLLTDALPRAGRPCELAATIANRGGELAGEVQVELSLPEGVRLAEGEHLAKAAAPDFFEPQQVRWRVVASHSGKAAFRLRTFLPRPVEAEAVEVFLPALDLPRAAYVPPPQPVRGAYEIGVYYFPGWAAWDRWEPIEAFPERRPVLGRYQEGSPEVADWHIKWAVEHGITFFCYDWYWHQGDVRLAHALHDGYFQARYRHLLKFCLLWANHPPTVHSAEDNARVCRYWIDNYFRRPEYFKLQGRPLVVIFSVQAMKRDLGVDGSRAAIELWHRMTRQAGVGEILVAGCGRGGGMLEEMQRMGFDAVTGYNWPSCGIEGRNFVPYAEVARHQLELWWKPMAEAKRMPVIVPTSPGWDARPWQGQRALVLTDRTPAAFEEHLRLAKGFVEATGQPKVALIEAWNEWGEGSYCEPHKEFGFGHLDAIRRVFFGDHGPHADFGPDDVGLAIPELTTPPQGKTAWGFDRDGDAEGWSPLMGLGDLQVRGGVLYARSTGPDPALRCAVRLPARQVRRIEVRLAVEGKGPDHGQLFWSTSLAPTSEPASVRFEVVPDGQMRTYRLEVGANSLWRGLITGLRLDPCAQRGATIRLDSVRATSDQ